MSDAIKRKIIEAVVVMFCIACFASCAAITNKSYNENKCQWKTDGRD